MNYKISFYKKIDALFGPFFVAVLRLLCDSAKIAITDIQSILIIRPGGIGDAVLLMPAIHVLKSKYPQTSINVLAEKRNAGIFLLCSDVDVIYHYDIPSELFRAIRRKYDVVIDTEQWHRFSAVVARLTKASILIGYVTNERKKLFSHEIPYSHDDYELHSFFHLLEPLSVPMSIAPPKTFLSIPSDFTNKIRSQLASVAGKKIVSLFPGGSIQERRWGSARFRQVARLIQQRGYALTIVGGSDDLKAGEEIAAGLEGVINLCGVLSLVETAAVLKETELLITGDSGIMHVGFGLGIKTLSLFGPGIEKKWAPRGAGHIAINKNLACSPCTKFGYTPKCKKNAECMKLITVDEVVQKALELLEG